MNNELAAIQVKNSRQKLNDIGEIPAVKNPELRAKCRVDFKLFCETYFKESVYLGWAEFHLTSIDLIKDVILHGAKYAWAMPRGSGKTTLARMAMVWALVYGHLHYPIVVGATADSGKNILNSMKMTLSSPGPIADDFPEICYPLLKLEGKSQATHSQTQNGERTRIVWTADKIVLPTIEGSKASGAVCQCFGLTGGLRGAFHTLPNGKTIRPDGAAIDDPQTDESAGSETQCNTRESLINSAVMKMSGPDVKMCAMMPCTIIEKNDLAARFLDRKANPSWRGTVTKMLSSMPKNMDFWEDEYKTVWEKGLLTDGDNGEITNIFYAQNRHILEEGMTNTWAARIEGNDVTANQTAMHIYLEDSNSFYSEYQNEPIDPFEDQGINLNIEALEGRCNPFKRNVVPSWVNRLVAHCDVGTKTGLHYTILGTGEGFSCAIVGFGHVDVETKRVSPEIGLAQALMEMIEKVCIEYAIDSTKEFMTVEALGVDVGYMPDTCYRIIREHPKSEILIPTKGEFVKPGAALYRTKDKRAVVGEGWIYTPVKNSTRPVRLLRFDANHWKTFNYNRLNGVLGAPGSMSMNGPFKNNKQYMLHLCSEYRRQIVYQNKKYDQWEMYPGRNNHYLDTLVGACLMACYKGASLDGNVDISKVRRRRKKKVFKRGA
jgi:hypothetical protein